MTITENVSNEEDIRVFHKLSTLTILPYLSFLSFNLGKISCVYVIY